MANKKNKKKATQNTDAAAAPSSKAEVKATKKSAEAKPSKGARGAKATKATAVTKSSSKVAKAKDKKGSKPGFFAGIARYFASVKSEMHRVTWPSKKELINYSVVVCASLVVVGVVIALLDFVIGEGLFLVSGLRG